jgi:hypothetical protein
VASFFLKTHVVANFLSYLDAHLLSYSLSKSDCAYPSRLRYYDPAKKCIHVLRHLRGLAAASVSTDDYHIVVGDRVDDLAAKLEDGQGGGLVELYLLINHKCN